MGLCSQHAPPRRHQSARKAPGFRAADEGGIRPAAALAPASGKILSLAAGSRSQLSHQFLLRLHSLSEQGAPPAFAPAVRVGPAARVRVLCPANSWGLSPGSPDSGTIFAAAPLCVPGCDPALDALDPIHGICILHSAHPSPTGVVRRS